MVYVHWRSLSTPFFRPGRGPPQAGQAPGKVAGSLKGKRQTGCVPRHHHFIVEGISGQYIPSTELE